MYRYIYIYILLVKPHPDTNPAAARPTRLESRGGGKL